MKSIQIEFPCDYPIKVIGKVDPDFETSVLAAVRTCAPELDPERITLRQSGKGNYVSMTLWIEATSESQLVTLFERLKETGKVKMVL